MNRPSVLVVDDSTVWLPLSKGTLASAAERAGSNTRCIDSETAASRNHPRRPKSRDHLPTGSIHVHVVRVEVTSDAAIVQRTPEKNRLLSNSEKTI